MLVKIWLMLYWANYHQKIISVLMDTSTKLIKSIKSVLVKPITIIINQMMKPDIFFDKLRLAISI